MLPARASSPPPRLRAVGAAVRPTPPRPRVMVPRSNPPPPSNDNDIDLLPDAEVELVEERESRVSLDLLATTRMRVPSFAAIERPAAVAPVVRRPADVT